RNQVQIATSPTNSYIDTGLNGGATYAYTVAAVDAAGNTSAPSQSASFATIVKAGDVDGNGVIDIIDLSILVSRYGQSGVTRAQGDLNNDGAVNIIDLSILLSNYGK
ncbi:MAG TPA: dockerin type I domain-containing protein, partial [Candidatus Polarisedimenticolaceae bacterium]|nr:dockerin type I domain-containing protein [Candidatus Polarisedimenticolaceae bacterium]